MQEKINCSRSISFWKCLKREEKISKLLKKITILEDIRYEPNRILQKRESNQII